MSDDTGRLSNTQEEIQTNYGIYRICGIIVMMII